MPKPARTEAPFPGAHLPVRVWDIVVRGFHWSLVLSFVVAWLTRHSNEDIHHLAGYAAAALVGLRVAWGVAGTHYARFAQFTRPPGAVLQVASAAKAGAATAIMARAIRLVRNMVYSLVRRMQPYPRPS